MPMKNDCPLEKLEHEWTIQYLTTFYPQALSNHSPNEGKRNVQYTDQLFNKMGVLRGFPDIFIYEPNNHYHGLAIELKRRKGGKVSEHQRRCLDALEARGYRAVVCRGFDEARDVIDNYMKEGVTFGRQKNDK